ncbi:ras association domain-containing protein 8 [Sitophilus oryzae]|uniref:Ras association domain-containing protein 8 n=1 Tax=Sitophilus oryzae TaxID=7048 RepID=A0A6J2YAK3_SITOR|nr:ras association domain-containing protein 8 [Sitophilus oryzae]XP_030759960.1 ras association domain-containing protein 8 [Sitophilus oryzae]XP_030759961.1 ras association domain-containing protein 8 [Sitophilus oryzae]
MELKIWVEGIQRIVCGVTEATTCQDVVFALAHATGKSGRFTLIERWRSNERQLAPQENPMKILLKWGEYSNDVQFILQRSDSKSGHSNNKPKPPQLFHFDVSRETQNRSFQNNSQNSGSENIGVVKGVQQVKTIHLEVREQYLSNSPHSSPKKSSYCGSDISERVLESPSHRVAPPYKDPPAPPPYRDPPPPNSNISHDKLKKNNFLDSKSQKDWSENRGKMPENALCNIQYKEMIALINFQREKLSNQQADLTKYDAEIIFWEGKEREKQLQLDFLTQEVLKISTLSKTNQDQIQALTYVEEECEIVKQQEKTLKSELTLLRSKLANCETELLQCKNKIRLLMEEFHMEQRMCSKKSESRKQIERNLLLELERIQKDIELAKQSSEIHHLTAETLKKEVAQLEIAIIEKKKQVEQLVNEMKEANLQSLSIVPPEDIRQILEGPNKGSTRKMIGSPRQLENAVPTSKNPHGVWV